MNDGPWEMDFERDDIVELVSLRRSSAEELLRWSIHKDIYCNVCLRVLKDGIGHIDSCPLLELERVLRP